MLRKEMAPLPHVGLGVPDPGAGGKCQGFDYVLQDLPVQRVRSQSLARLEDAHCGHSLFSPNKCLSQTPSSPDPRVGPGMTEQHASGCVYVVEEGEVGSEGPGRVPQFSWGLATQNPPEEQLW